MADIPDPIGRVVRDLSMVRGEARTAFLRLPATDPLRLVLDQVDKILGNAESNIGKATQGITTQAGRVLPSGPGFPSIQAQRIVGAGPEAWARALQKRFGG